jgi:Xaa-Pro aminopeptidase
MAFTGSQPPQELQEAWRLVRDARRAVPRLVAERMAQGLPVMGWEADFAARAVIEAAGQGDAFLHRTGHSIDTEVHGRGANLDGLETRDERLLLPGSVMSVEPGLYYPHFGVRSENNLVITSEGLVLVAEGTDQEDLLLMA